MNTGTKRLFGKARGKNFNPDGGTERARLKGQVGGEETLEINQNNRKEKYKGKKKNRSARMWPKGGKCQPQVGEKCSNSKR